MRARIPNVSDSEAAVLAFLAAEYNEDAGCFAFAPICRATGLERTTARLACRSLMRKGLARFHRGLWTDSGEPAGAGYSCTWHGKALADCLAAFAPAREGGAA